MPAHALVSALASASLLAIAPHAVHAQADPPADRLLLEEDFEGGLDRWIVTDSSRARVVRTADPGRGRALQLEPNGHSVVVLARRGVTNAGSGQSNSVSRSMVAARGFW